MFVSDVLHVSGSRLRVADRRRVLLPAVPDVRVLFRRRAFVPATRVFGLSNEDAHALCTTLNVFVSTVSIANSR